MKKVLLLFLTFIYLPLTAAPQPSVLKYFEGEWEGTVKDFDAKGKEIQKFKARRILKFVSPDTLRGTYQIFGANIESQPVRVEIIEAEKGFIYKQAGRAYAGDFKDKTFTFQGKDENEMEIKQSHFFVGGDMEFLKVEQTDPATKVKIVRLQGVFKLKKG